ncbi:MAG: response regulator [bacterium]|nr:response regulator [bacterium]
MPHNPPLILYVEDDGMLLTMYEQFFTIHGFSFAGAASFTAGMEMIPAQMPDVVLLDLLLPNTTTPIPEHVNHHLGLQLLEEIKKNSKTKGIPVIILSNIDEASVVQNAKELGAYDFLVKAKVVPHDTLDKVKEILTARNIPLPKKRQV